MQKIFDDDPTEQPEPFEEDPAEQIDPLAADPTEGIPTSDEWKNPEPLEECPVVRPQAARWQEHSYDHFDTGRWASGVCIELARFAVPPGEQGVITKVETAALGFQPEPDPGPIPGYGEWWPWFYDLWNQFDDPIALAFYLRLQTWQREGLEPAPMITPTQAGLPGFPFPPLGEWHDARYDYARKYNPVRMHVPEGHYVRLFVELALRDYTRIFKVWGRIAGATQNYRDNQQATDEARTWPR